MKITEIKPAGVWPPSGNEGSTSAEGSRRAGPSRSPSPPDERLGGRPPQDPGAEGSRRRLSITALQTSQSGQHTQIDPAHSDRSSRSPESWVSIPLQGSVSGASDRATRGSELGASDRHTVEIEGRAPALAHSWRATVASALGSLANSATAAAGAAGGSIGAALGQLAASAGTHASQAAGAVAGELRQQGEALGMVLPSKRVLGALAGHLVHQSAAVGVPTFLREMMAEALTLSVRHMPPDHALALQVVAGTASVGAQFLRRRQEARNPNEAARAFHALTPEQWNALPADRQAKLRRDQDLHSRMAMNIQVAASMTHIGIGAYAVRSQDKALAEMPARLLVGDLKGMVYAAMRDSVQASFSMVGTAEATQGLIGPHLTASAAAYSMTTVTGNYAFSYLPPLVPNASLATAVLRGESDQMSNREAWMTRAAVSAVKAAINTGVHTSDWSFMTQQEANQSGTVQRWDPKLKFLKPESRDYSRLLDNTPARITLIAGGSATSNAVDLAMRDMPGWASTAAVNLIGGAYEGLIYKTIGNTWQAQAAVRAAAAAPSPTLGETQPSLSRTESGSGVSGQTAVSRQSGASTQQRGQA